MRLVTLHLICKSLMFICFLRFHLFSKKMLRGGEGSANGGRGGERKQSTVSQHEEEKEEEDDAQISIEK